MNLKIAALLLAVTPATGFTASSVSRYVGWNCFEGKNPEIRSEAIFCATTNVHFHKLKPRVLRYLFKQQSRLLHKYSRFLLICFTFFYYHQPPQLGPLRIDVPSVPIVIHCRLESGQLEKKESLARPQLRRPRRTRRSH